MKKTIPLFIVIATFLISNNFGQIEPKKIILKGSSHLQAFTNKTKYESNTSSYTVKTSQFNFQPSLGICLSYHALWGLYADYYYKKVFDDNNNNITNKSLTFTVGQYFRYYTHETDFSPFLEAKIGYLKMKAKEKYSNSKEKEILNIPGLNYSFGIGCEYFIKEKFSVELLVNYSGSKVKESKENTSFYGTSVETLKIINNGVFFNIGASIIIN